MFRIFTTFLNVITRLPLRVLYLLSDVLAPFLYHIVRYRRKVVRRNLTQSFPEKNSAEIKKIERKFYRYFCDLFIETLYQLNMTEDEMRRRVKFVNTELILEQYSKGKSVMILSAHYGNWEWMASMSLLFPNDKPAYNVYKKLKNKAFDAFMYNMRMRFGSRNIEMQDTFRTLLTLKNTKQLASFGMISDQTPTAAATRHWITFLNQDTPVLVGAEQLARKFDYPVVFGSISRIKRGFYRFEFVLIKEDPRLASEFEITEKYMQLLEAKIMESPEFWLWTHKRWKHRKPTQL
ncbi:MAG: lysophospholipid acyltransferase family protein [Paludibacteraceae bacterium]|nr:lysophospholipid acyltransferase family protein [Paludibacteraceae bacterium]